MRFTNVYFCDLLYLLLIVKCYSYVSARYTYEMAPVHFLIEKVVLEKMMDMMGWVEGGDGIFNPGIYIPIV